MAGNVRGDVAVVTGNANSVRTLYLRRAGSTVFRVALKIPVSRDRARDATVALGPKGDVLVVWEDNHVIFARHLGPTGHADFVNGHRGTPQVLSPTGVDAVLGDAAVGTAGAATVAWRAGVLGSDPAPGANPTVFASHRAAGQTAFGPPEQVSTTGENVAFPPFVAVDPVSGRSFVAYSLLGPALKVSARP